MQGPRTRTWINHTSSKAEFWKLKNICEKPDSPYCLNDILGNMFTMPFLMGEFTSMIVKHTDLVGRMSRIQQHNVTGNRPMVPGLGIHFTPTGFAVHILRASLMDPPTARCKAERYGACCDGPHHHSMLCSTDQPIIGVVALPNKLQPHRQTPAPFSLLVSLSSI